jgi:hypothetical protein
MPQTNALHFCRLAALSLVAVLPAAWADTPVPIYSDLINTATPGGYIVGQYSPGNTYAIGAAFTPMDNSYSFTQFKALLSAQPRGLMKIGLYADAAGVPGALLESWAPFSLTSAPEIVTLPSAVHPLLVRGTQYWVVASMFDPTSVGVWWINNIRGSDGVPLQGIATASLNGAAFAPGALTTAGMHAFEVDGTIAGGPAAVSTYHLTGTLQWNSGNGPDLIGGNGKPFNMIVNINNGTPTSVSNPGVTTDDYNGTGTLQIGSSMISLGSTNTAFLHFSASNNDATEFFLFPPSGSTQYYVPVISFIGQDNTSLEPPPTYPAGAPVAFVEMVVQPQGGTTAATYTVLNSTFTSAPTPIAPPRGVLGGGGR